MTELSVAVEGVAGLTWPLWQHLIEVVDGRGFAGMYLSDHFTVPVPSYPDSLEMMVALGYLANHSRHVRFGPLVAPLSFRDPVLLARQAIALDNLSGGRMVLGVGAGWMEREHEMFGYPLGDMRTRLDRFAEGLEVMALLLRSAAPVSYAGHFFHLCDALLKPRPDRPGRPPLLIGASGPRRSLPLVARYADIWNGQTMSPDTYRMRSGQLDEMLLTAGRQPADVKRTFNTPVLCGRDSAEMERRVSSARRLLGMADQPLAAVLATFRAIFPTTIVGSPGSVVEQIQRYSAAGVEEVTIQWMNLDDIEGLHLLAEEVLPHV
jgi:alkanesulfonate monooxygenase SsuD/methylene tetrahydromethanopterin reductase-like flavin-dependent oxidoreductase (luciferase family)